MNLDQSERFSQQVMSRLVGPPNRIRLNLDDSYPRISDPMSRSRPKRLDTHIGNYLRYWLNLSY